MQYQFGRALGVEADLAHPNNVLTQGGTSIIIVTGFM